MSGRFLLDTNIIIALFGEDASVKKQLAHADEVFISSTVLGELYFGAHKSKHVKKKSIKNRELCLMQRCSAMRY